MTITAQTANRTLKLIRFCDGSPERALADCRMQLRAIQPYTDRHLSRVESVLCLLSRVEEPRRTHLMGQLTVIAAKADPLNPDATHATK